MKHTQRQPITLHDALDCGLTTTDRDLVETVITLAGATAAYTLPTGIYTGFTNDAGQVVAYLHTSHTYLTVTPRAAHIPTYLPGKPTSDNIEPGGWDIILDPWQPTKTRLHGYTAPRTTPEPRTTYCTTCWISTPTATGTCPRCDDND